MMKEVAPRRGICQGGKLQHDCCNSLRVGECDAELNWDEGGAAPRYISSGMLQHYCCNSVRAGECDAELNWDEGGAAPR